MTRLKAQRQRTDIQNPYTSISTMTSRVKMPRFRSWGGRSRISGAATSIPNPMSGGPDVTMITQRISTGASGKTERRDASLKASPTSKVHACAIFSARRCKTNFWILSNMRRPSSMALRIDAKLSSVRMISEASFATSEPDSPIAIPTSARLREGESLTPSPVWKASLV